MSTYAHITSWIAASRNEAILARHLRIEESDLLLGLLAQGGEVARELGRAGVSLAQARAGIAGLDDADLARAGIAVPAGVRPERLKASMSALEDPADLDWSEEAESIIFERKGKVRSDRAALQVMLGREDSTTARVLVHLGVDLEALRKRLNAQDRDDSSSVKRVRVPQVWRRQGLEDAGVCTRFISAPVETVAAVLGDPSGDCWVRQGGEIVDARPGEVITDRRRRNGTVVRMRHRHQRDRDGSIVWSSQATSGRYAGELVSVREYRLTGAPGGTLVSLTLITRGFGPIGALVRPLSRLFSGFGIRHQMVLTAALCAENRAA